MQRHHPLYATVAGAAQTILRGGANDPQVQLAEDAAARLGQGASAATLVGSAVDMGASLAPFLIVHDRQGRVLASSGQLNGRTPTLPAGVLQGTALGRGRNVTRQLRPGVRIAAVAVTTSQVYVPSGRSLREVERPSAIRSGSWSRPGRYSCARASSSGSMPCYSKSQRSTRGARA